MPLSNPPRARSMGQMTPGGGLAGGMRVPARRATRTGMGRGMADCRPLATARTGMSLHDRLEVRKKKSHEAGASKVKKLTKAADAYQSVEVEEMEDLLQFETKKPSWNEERARRLLAAAACVCLPPAN